MRGKFDASFFSSRDVGDAVPYKIFGMFRKEAVPSSRFSLALGERVRVRE